MTKRASCRSLGLPAAVELLCQPLQAVGMVLAVPQKSAWPLFSHSSHTCCSLSSISLLSFFLQNEQKTLSMPGDVTPIGSAL